MTREGDGNGEGVRAKGGTGGQRHIGKERSAQKGGIWRGGMALGSEVSSEVLVRNSKLRTVDRTIKRFPSGRCPVISCSEVAGGKVSVKVAKHQLVSTVHQNGIKVRGVVPEVGGAGGIYMLTKVSVVSPSYKELQ